MHVKIDETQKRCELWIPHADQFHYKSTPQYQEIVKTYKNQGYSICVYIGGTVSLLPNITALLDQQTPDSMLM